MIVDIYALTPEKVEDIKLSVDKIKFDLSILDVDIYLKVKNQLEKIETELTKHVRYKKVDSKNFIK